VQVTS